MSNSELKNPEFESRHEHILELSVGNPRGVYFGMWQKLINDEINSKEFELSGAQDTAVGRAYRDLGLYSLRRSPLTTDFRSSTDQIRLHLSDSRYYLTQAYSDSENTEHHPEVASELGATFTALGRLSVYRAVVDGPESRRRYMMMAVNRFNEAEDLLAAGDNQYYQAVNKYHQARAFSAFGLSKRLKMYFDSLRTIDPNHPDSEVFNNKYKTASALGAISLKPLVIEGIKRKP